MKAISSTGVTKVFTGTIGSDLFDWIDHYAKSQSRTKRDIMEKAIINYRNKIKKEKAEEGFKKLAKDKGVIEMAEWGMDDYANNVL